MNDAPSSITERVTTHLSLYVFFLLLLVYLLLPPLFDDFSLQSPSSYCIDIKKCALWRPMKNLFRHLIVWCCTVPCEMCQRRRKKRKYLVS